MDPQFNPALARLRKLTLVTLLVIGPFLAFQIGNAQSVATATLTSGGMNSVTIDPNGTFTLILGVTTNFPSGGYSVLYQSNNGSGLFEITGRTNLNPFFTDGTNPPFPELLAPSNLRDLGYTGDQINNQPPGTFDLQSVDFRTLNAPVGTYTIFLDNRSIMGDRTGGGFFDVNMGGASGPMFTVNVVPEPATMGLLMIAGAVMSVVAWRKRRAAA
jgi:hypothetical protein